MKKIILFILLISSPYLYGAGPPKPLPCGKGNQPPCPPTPPNIPIDGGISILLAMGVGYGIKKTINLNKDENKNN